MCVAVVGAALVLLTAPVSAEAQVPRPEVASLEDIWEVVSDFWSSLFTLLAPFTEANSPAPIDRPSTPEVLCSVGCGERGVEIDPNG